MFSSFSSVILYHIFYHTIYIILILRKNFSKKNAYLQQFSMFPCYAKISAGKPLKYSYSKYIKVEEPHLFLIYLEYL